MKNTYYAARMLAAYIQMYNLTPQEQLEETFSVARHVTHDGEEYYTISPVIGDGYTGYSSETRYMDGTEDGTFWREQVGTLPECVEYVYTH